MRYHFGLLLRMVHNALDQRVNEALQKLDLTAAQGHIMGFLIRQPEPPCSRDVEAAFHLSHPTVSGVLARMEKKGFLELRTDEEDRRVKRIVLLPKGRDCAQALKKGFDDTEEALVAGFSPEEREQFRAYLSRVVDNLGGWPAHFCKEETQ